MAAWISVTVKSCQEFITARQVVQCSWDSSFGSLLAKIDPKLERETVSHIHISKQENFLDPHNVPVTAPVSLCEQFNCRHVCIYLKRDTEAQPLTRTVASACLDGKDDYLSFVKNISFNDIHDKLMKFIV